MELEKLWISFSFLKKPIVNETVNLGCKVEVFGKKGKNPKTAKETKTQDHYLDWGTF